MLESIALRPCRSRSTLGTRVFFLVCVGELRFIGRRPKTRAAKFFARVTFLGLDRNWKSRMNSLCHLPFSSEGKIWPFHVVFVQGWQGNEQKSLMHVQSCCFAH